MNLIKYFLALLTLVALANCSTTTAETEKPKEKISVENIVDVLKNIPFPKF
jgi:hypothetical protein